MKTIAPMVQSPDSQLSHLKLTACYVILCSRQRQAIYNQNYKMNSQYLWTVPD